MKCKFCNSEDSVQVSAIKSSINNKNYTLFKCNSCNSRFFDLNQYPTELNDLYDELSINREKFSIDFSESKKWLKEKKIILQVLKKHPISMLDVGCRTGDFLMHFDKKINREGVELSKSYYEIGIQRGLNIYNDYLENIEFKNSYDIVSCYAILEHLVKPVIFLDELQGLVNKKGILIIMIPTFQSIKAWLYKYIKPTWHMYSPPEHLNFYSRKYIDSYLKENGFILKKRYYSSGGMTFSTKNNLIKKIEQFFNLLIDNTFLNKFPIFDHMYSYYYKN